MVYIIFLKFGLKDECYTMEICITMAYLYIKRRYGYLIFGKLTRYFCFHNALSNVMFIILHLEQIHFIVAQIYKKYVGQNGINTLGKIA